MNAIEKTSIDQTKFIVIPLEINKDPIEKKIMNIKTGKRKKLRLKE